MVHLLFLASLLEIFLGKHTSIQVILALCVLLKFLAFSEKERQAGFQAEGLPFLLLSLDFLFVLLQNSSVSNPGSSLAIVQNRRTY